MVGDNKILTVSYGTFSCTLEGFDDPFSTMKNIAEYFRDLAAGDRFFGAEPPQPDPEMLQSIAEQTIQARVNAQLSDNNLVLRQKGSSGSAPSVIPPVAAVAAAAVAAPRVAPAEASGFETVAEKLQRIRAVVSREAAQDALFSEDQHVDEFAAETTAPLSALDDSAYEPVIDTQPSAPMVDPIAQDDIAVDDIALDDAPVAAQDAPEQPVVSEDATAFEDEEAAVEQPVVSEDAEVTPDADFMKSDTTADAAEFDEEEADALDDIDLSSIAGAASADADDSAPDADVAETAEQADTVDDATLREDAAETAVDNVLGRVSEDGDAPDATPRRRIVVQKITREDVKAARNEAEAAAEAAKDDSDTVADAPEAAADATSGDLPAEQEEELLRELAALQADDTAAEMTIENAPTLETQDTDVDDVMDAAEASDDTEESADDALASALSDLVSEDEREHQQEELEAARKARRERRDAIIEDDENDVERLISTTTSRIDNDESSQRRASIAHLKAAVAATKADASLTEAAQEHEARERDQYAEDLARVVRPERATRSTERAKTDRPAPLVLVSELRIDKPTDSATDTADETAEVSKDEGPVRPRRVNRAAADEAEAADDENMFNEAEKGSFADYAASANALELPDLLEAAAAYYTYVESTEQFTRPMLMRKIASISARDGFSREAGLRSFGTLLREGKLVKDGNGKFVIAKTSRFTPEARYAGE